ncbi:MAG: FAD-binding oxidoreductase, partial [Actinomycetota bacterium]|nr:FAD-binding oxidoreductase [Actinomycetota bacterium]
GWDADPALPAWPGRPSLDGPVTADACVVGLGGSGLAAVDELTSRGLSVVGIDAGRVAGGAAGRNGGFLLGGGAPSIEDAARRWGAEVALELYRRTLGELDRLTERLGPAVIRRAGSIRLAGLPGEPRDANEAAERAREWADCRAQQEFLTAAGIAVQTYDGPLGQGIYLPDDGATNPAHRAFALAETAEPARLFEHSRVRSVATGWVETATGSVSAGLVIVAVDGRLELLLPQLASLVRTARLQMLATAPGLAPRLPCPVYGRWGYDYAQQDSAGRILAGGGRDRFAAQEWTTDDRPSAPVQGWIEQVAGRMAGGPVQVRHRWAASVGYTADGRALCLPVADAVMACGGYSGTGNLVGPVAVRAAIAHALDGAPVPEYFHSSL